MKHIKGYHNFHIKEEVMACPAATQNLELNTKNRDKAIKATKAKKKVKKENIETKMNR